MSDTHPSIFPLTNKVEKNQEPNKVFSHTEENILHLIEIKEEGRRERGRKRGQRGRERKKVFSHERPRRINLNREGRKVKRTVALRQVAAAVTETVTVGQRRDSLTGRT